MPDNEKKSGAFNADDKNIQPSDQENNQHNNVQNIVENFPYTHEEWENKKTILQEHHPELTDEDLEYQEGMHTELYRRLENKLGKNNDEVKRMMEGI
jgi:hypothetical protein